LLDQNWIDRTEVIKALLDAVPKDRMIQVRYPQLKQRVIYGVNANVSSASLTDAEAYGETDKARIGFHNDCFLASADDYGTYTNVQADKEYISNEGLFVPTGGETCPPDPPGSTPTCPVATSTMKQLRWTYLNLDWYKPTIDSWKAAGCFEELQRNLGYRLALETASFPGQVAVDQELTVNIKITNKGYAPLYNHKITTLVLKNNTSGEIHEIELPVDLRECKPLAEFKIDKIVKTTGILQGVYDLYLKISDNSTSLKNRSEYSVRLANTNVWVEENGGMNNLKHQLKIGD